MAETLSSAIVQESMSQMLSRMVQRYEETQESNVNIKLERLEMAHIKLEAAIETAEKWEITDPSLLRWRRKLKRVAQECDDTLHKWKQRILEHEHVEEEVKNSLPTRIANATKSFFLSIFSSSDELSSSTVQRFEWFAAGASEFLRFVNLGGTARRHIPFHSLVNNLFEGKELHHKVVQGNGYPLFQLWLAPHSTSEHGMEANLVCIQNDGTTPEGCIIYFGLMLQLSESTDIVGTAIKCLQLFASQFKSPVESVRKELIQLPTQDLSWVPHVYSCQNDHWDNLHRLGSQWFRPNPSCCKQYDRHDLHRISNPYIAELSDVSLEPLILVNFQCQVSLSLCSEYNTLLSEHKVSLEGPPYLKAGINFEPHGSSGGMLPENMRSAIGTIAGKEQRWLHADITLEQLGEIILQKAINYFYQNTGASVYQMIWKSKHGSARIQFEKPSTSTQRTRMRTRGTFGRARKTKSFQAHEPTSRTNMISHLMNLWGTYVPNQLQGLFMDWVEKEKEIQLRAAQLDLKRRVLQH